MNGLDLLKKETPEEKISRLERELKTERIGRNNDSKFADDEYKQLAEFALEMCDDGSCEGDYSVGIFPCKYWIDAEVSGCGYGYCKLKKFCGMDIE